MQKKTHKNSAQHLHIIPVYVIQNITLIFWDMSYFKLDVLTDTLKVHGDVQ